MRILLKRPAIATVLIAFCLLFVLVFSGCPWKPKPAVLDIEIYSPNDADSISFSIVQKSTGDTIIVVDTLSKSGNGETINGVYNFSISLPDKGEYSFDYLSQSGDDVCNCTNQPDLIAFSQNNIPIRTIARKEYGDTLEALITVNKPSATSVGGNLPIGRSMQNAQVNNWSVSVGPLECRSCLMDILFVYGTYSGGSIDPAPKMELNSCQDRPSSAFSIDGGSSLEGYLNSTLAPTSPIDLSGYSYYFFYFTGSDGSYFLNVSSDLPWYLVQLGAGACYAISKCGNLGDLDELGRSEFSTSIDMSNQATSSGNTYTSPPAQCSLDSNACYLLVFDYEEKWEEKRTLKFPPFCIEKTPAEYYNR